MRSSVQWNDVQLVHHLRQEHDVLRILKDLVCGTDRFRRLGATLSRYSARRTVDPRDCRRARRETASAQRPCLRRRFSASGVSGGIRPSGGSMMSDVRLVGLMGSRQNALYVPGSPATTTGSFERFAAAALFALLEFLRREHRFSPDAAGRSRGVSVAFVQTPCRSGWPHGVRHCIDAAPLPGLESLSRSCPVRTTAARTATAMDSHVSPDSSFMTA